MLHQLITVLGAHMGDISPAHVTTHRHEHRPDEVIHNVPGMYIDGDECCQGAAVQVRQGRSDHAGEGPQLLATRQQVLGQGCRRAGGSQAFLHSHAPICLQAMCQTCCTLSQQFTSLSGVGAEGYRGAAARRVGGQAVLLTPDILPVLCIANELFMDRTHAPGASTASDWGSG